MRRIGVLVVAFASLSVWVAAAAMAGGGGSRMGTATLRPADIRLDATSPLSNCSTPLKLHDGANQTGATASISERGVWVNLSSVGFDNRTSSYTVGACAVELASAAFGGGVRYTHCLTAGCVEDSMDLGWDNVLSSVFLH
jgi:hypothetical protein